MNNPKNAAGYEPQENEEPVEWPEEDESEIVPQNELNYPLLLNAVLPLDIRVVRSIFCSPYFSAGQLIFRSISLGWLGGSATRLVITFQLLPKSVQVCKISSLLGRS